MVFFHNMIHPGSTAVNGGFVYMFPTRPTFKVLHELHKMMMKLADTIKNWPPEKAVSEGENDQVYLNRLVLNKYGGMEATMMPFSEFPDGKWFTASESQRISWHPYVIHNNWIIGREEKMKRAKQWGHWFIKDNGECDDEQVKKIINL
ncbi:Hypothetical predicted protein [Mytilus galloprovincialis]|uniref:Nucleotide-diphospho-sugar transferase domain-containing protein n=1 Tax=Mytilus galloprovincialis TaxID=29158 RepID=A0A8B6GXN9_MYTGA|nr:Hypothetical predicted protein [Mytilus galloprovincialis]